MMTFQPPAEGSRWVLCPPAPFSRARHGCGEGGPSGRSREPRTPWETAAEVSGQPGYTGDRRGHVSPRVLYFLENWHGNLQSSASTCASQTQRNLSSRCWEVTWCWHFFFFFGAEQGHTYMGKPRVQVATPAIREEVQPSPLA